MRQGALLSLAISSCLLLAGPAAADPLAAARAHLAAGEFDKVLDDLADSANLPAKPVAALFGEAATMARQKNDGAMASLYCERGLKRDAREPQALRACAAIAVEEERFEEADRWTEVLGQLFPEDPEVAILQARCARARGSWEMVVALLEPHQSDDAVRSRIAPLLEEARQRSKEDGEARAQQQEFDRKIADALGQAREADRGRDRAREELQQAVPRTKKHRPVGEKVLLFTTRSCGAACEQARSWLQANGIEYTEKDADKGHLTRQETIKRCKKAKIRGDCPVPLFDVNGEVVAGFDPVRLKKLLEL